MINNKYMNILSIIMNFFNNVYKYIANFFSTNDTYMETHSDNNKNYFELLDKVTDKTTDHVVELKFDVYDDDYTL